MTFFFNEILFSLSLFFFSLDFDFFPSHFVSVEEGESRLFDKFVQVEKQVYTFTKQMKAFVTFASTICLFLPCIYQAIRFILGIYSHNDWWLPYKFA